MPKLCETLSSSRATSRSGSTSRVEFARRGFELDDKHALMTRAVFERLDDYSCTTPSGVFSGKIWKRGEPYRSPTRWFLGEYYDNGSADPKKNIGIRWREILIVEDE